MTSIDIDWSQVKKITLWHYDDLIEKLIDVLNYGFVGEHYSHTLAEASRYATNIHKGYVINTKENTAIGAIPGHFQALERAGVTNYVDLVQKVRSKAKCEAFLAKTGFSFEALIHVLNFMLRWVLPFRIPVRELIDTLEKSDELWLATLKKQKIRSNLDVIERFRAKKERSRFSTETGIPESVLLDMAHRADMSRLAFVRGKTIKHLCGGGYDTLAKIAKADLTRMEADMAAYYANLGKRPADFRRVIPLDWMIGGARILPKVIEA